MSSNGFWSLMSTILTARCTKQRHRSRFQIGLVLTVVFCSHHPVLASEDLTGWHEIDPFESYSKSNPSSGSVSLDEVGNGPCWITNDFSLPGVARFAITLTVLSTATDDDFIGFAFAYRDSTHFILVDWRRQDQLHDWGDSVIENDDFAETGIKVKKIDGSWTRDGLWGGSDGIGVSTLAGPAYGGWEPGRSYRFEVICESGHATVLRDGMVVFDIYDEAVTAGAIALYGFSQDDLLFSQVTVGQTVSHDLVAHWSFNEGSGAIAHDTSGHGNDGTITGATWDAGIAGSALHFDGIDDYVVRSQFAPFPFDSISVALWVKSSDQTRNGTPFSYAVPSNGNEYLLYNCSALEVYVGGERRAAGQYLTDGGWHHLVATWLSATGQLYVYVDSALGYTDVIQQGHLLENLGTLICGQEQDVVGGGFDPTQAFEGLIDEVRVYDRVLTSGEIQWLYLSDRGVYLTVDGTGNLGPMSLNLWGNHQYDAVYVVNGGHIAVSPAVWNEDLQEWEGGYLMLQANTIYVDSTSSIESDGTGFSRDPFSPDGHSGGGPGHGRQGGDVNGLTSGGGGAFGGWGGSWWTTAQPGLPYGDAYWNQDDTNVDRIFGSAGGDYIFEFGDPPTILAAAFGGLGGGYIRLSGTNVTIQGTISADGGPGYPAQESIGSLPDGLGSGGGSGGQIVLDSANLTVTGYLYARGGNGSSPADMYSGGGGSGGRIKILQPSAGICGGTISVSGGNGAQGMARGEPGTIYIPNAPPSAAPTELDLLTDDDKGRSNSDHITNVPRPRITGSGPASSIIRLYETITTLGTGESGTDGHFAVVISSALSDGPHTITATAQGFCNSESAISSASLEVTIDTQAPAPPTGLDLPENSDTGSSQEDNITRDWGPQIAGSGPSDSDITLYKGSTSLGTAYTAGGEWTIMSDRLVEGWHQLTATAKDAAGNESAPSSAFSILVDLTPPTITQTTASPTECWPVGKVFQFTLTASDALAGMAPPFWQEAELRKDSTSITVNLNDGGNNPYLGIWDTDGREAGTYAVGFRAVDVAGNIQLLENAATICLLPACPADFDHDGDVDSADFDLFEPCASGPGVPYSAGCEGKDLDHDGDVDQDDFGILQRCLSGESNPVDPSCIIE